MLAPREINELCVLDTSAEMFMPCLVRHVANPHRWPGAQLRALKLSARHHKPLRLPLWRVSHAGVGEQICVATARREDAPRRSATGVRR